MLIELKVKWGVGQEHNDEAERLACMELARVRIASRRAINITNGRWCYMICALICSCCPCSSRSSYSSGLYAGTRPVGRQGYAE